ncbi:MAG: replication restart helicase PriA [Terriglobales bacterium]
MSAGFVDVVLPVPLDGAFTYTLPEALPAPAIGARVLVPWGRRRLVGVAVGQRDELPPGLKPEQARPLEAVLDSEAIVAAPVLEMVRWAAAYYQAPVGEVMRCALPPGPSAKDGVRAPLPRRAWWRLAEAGVAAAGRSTSAQARVLELLRAAGGEMEASALARDASASAIATLARRGVLQRCEREAPAPAPAWAPRPRIRNLNAPQQAALEAIFQPGVRTPVLLHGVTGSGKTAVYLAAIAAALERGETALLLVPEIGLTPALFADFTDAFPGQVAVLHSGLSAGERARHWERLRRGEARVAVGPRSAVFAPLARLGLILVDEEHDASFKQQETPRYHARDLAVLRARLENTRIVLGSATPSLESYAHARGGKYRLLEMRQRVEARPLPAMRLVDMGGEFRRRAAAGAPARREPDAPEELLSEELRQAIQQRLESGQQSLLLINRRGFAPVVLCRACGAAVQCRDCSLALTFHKRAGRLLCHLCGFSTEPPARCPACDSEHIYFLGSGSEKVEEMLAAQWPRARIARLDRDTARSRGHLERVLARFRDGGLDILVGTQMIAKGHDLPGVTLVGVLHADRGLTFPDFRAAERTFQLLTQVAGRAGRGDTPGEVILQVMHPGHYAVETAVRADFTAFYEKEAEFRRWMHYPPFAALAAAQLRHRDYDQVLDYATRAGRFLKAHAERYASTRVLGPSPALLARAKNEYRFQFLFKSASRRELNALLSSLRAFARQEKFPATALAVDVDPLNL